MKQTANQSRTGFRAAPVTIAVVLAFMLVVASCAGASDTGEAGESVDEWVFPSTAMTTGPLAIWGNKLQFARQYAVDQINAAGGIAGKPVRLEMFDDQLDPNIAASIFAEIAPWALVAMGPTADTAVRGAAPVAVSNEFLQSVSCTGAEVAADYVPWVYSSLAPSVQAYPGGVRAWIKLNPDIKKVVPIVSNDHAMWNSDTQIVEKILNDMGVETTSWVEVPDGTLDFGPPALKALAEDAQGYWFAANPLAIGKMIVELDERGMTDKEKVLIFPHGEDPELWEAAQGKLEGAYLMRYLDMNSQSPRWQAFLEYAEEQGEEAFFCSPDIIDEPYLVKEAIETLGITGDLGKLEEERVLIRDYICNVKDFEFVMGTSDVIDCFKQTPSYIFQATASEFVLVSQVDVDGNPLD